MALTNCVFAFSTILVFLDGATVGIGGCWFEDLIDVLISWNYWVFFSDVRVQIGGLVWAVVT